MDNTFRITLKKIRSTVGLELNLNEKRLIFYTENPVDGVQVRDFGDTQVIEINPDLVKRAEVHVFTTELNEIMDGAGDSVVELHIGCMLIERQILTKLGHGYGYKVFELKNCEYNIKTIEFK